jgi:hypothetical protein
MERGDLPVTINLIRINEQLRTIRDAAQKISDEIDQAVRTAGHPGIDRRRVEDRRSGVDRRKT